MTTRTTTTTTASSSSTTRTSSSSSRYELLKTVLKKVLTQTKSQLNVAQTVQDCCGSADVSIFDGAAATYLTSLLEQLHEGWLEDMQDVVLEQHDVQAKLDRLDAALQHVLALEAAEQEAEAHDKESAARAALQACENGIHEDDDKNVSPDDVVNRKAYQQMLQARDALRAQVEAAEAQSAALRAAYQARTEAMARRLQAMAQVRQAMETAADQCSMISS